MTRTGLLGLFVLLCVCPALFAKPGVVKTSEGITYEGEIDEKDPNAVTVTVRGIPTTINRGHITSITYSNQNLQQSFPQRKQQLVAARNANGLIALAREAFDQREYLLAREAIEAALEIDPNNADAVALRETITGQIRLERNKPRPDEAAPPATREAAATQPATNQKTLGPVEINAIRQAEMNENDAGVRIRFERNVVKRFIDYTSTPPGDFYALNVMQQAQRILAKGPLEMRKDVIIQNDPPAMLQYRRLVQPFLVQNCATAGCHNGALKNKWNMVLPPDSEAATYTNFYLLQKYVKPLKQSGDTVFGTGDLKMIDRQRPEKSLMLQYTLPAAISEFDHPDAPNFRPPLHGLNDPRYRQLLDWVSKSLQQIEPDYGFEFGAPATQPASQPATQPATVPARPATRPLAPRPVAPPPRPVTPQPRQAPPR